MSFRSEHLKKKNLIGRLLILLISFVFIAGCGESGICSGSENASSGDGSQNSSEDLLATAHAPVIISKELDDDDYNYRQVILRMLGTEKLADFTQSEILTALIEPDKVPEFDLVQNPDSFKITNRDIAHVGSTTFDLNIHFEKLSLFEDYYREFMEKHESPLRRQKNIDEFKDEFSRIHLKYRKMLKDANEKHYGVRVRILAIDPSYYDVQNEVLNLPLDSYSGDNALLKNLVKLMNGEYNCAGTINLAAKKRVWEKIIANYEDVKELHIPINIDEVEKIIEHTKSKLGVIDVILKNNEELWQHWGCDKPRITMSAKVLAMRLQIQTDDKEFSYKIEFNTD